MEQMKNLYSFLPFVIALLCAGFASTQDVFMGVTDWLGALSMELNYGWFTILLIVLFTTLCCYLLKINWRKYQYSEALSATLLFIVVTTFYYRFFSGNYWYVSIVWGFTYVDVLWLLALAFFVESLVNNCTQHSAYEEKESSILLDSPIESPDEDKFDYYSEALHIAKTLAQLPHNRSVSVAILSPWGNGKTSFVNLIKYAIRHGGNGGSMFDHIIVEFNPRQCKDVSTIQEDFFKVLADSIPDEAKIRNKIANYLEKIGVHNVHPIVGIFAGVVKGTRDNATDNVNRALDKLGKRLIVFIDDFDRLVDVEIIEVLKLIDKNAAFRHTIFITAYDEGAVSKALKRYSSDKDIAYIDKFFTLRFHLPLRSDVSVVNSVYQILVKKVSGDIELLSIMNKRFRIIAECVRNLREAKNFCNMFLMDYAFNSKHEIDFDEYFLLELMKFRYYDDYCSLYRKEYVENGSIFQSPNADAVLTLKEKYSRDKNGKEPEGELPRSINILRCIFEDYKFGNLYGYSTKNPSFRSVKYLKYFDMYFTNRSYGHVQAEALESLYTMQDNEEIDKFYRQCIQMKAESDIVDFLRYQNWQDFTPKGSLTKRDTFKQFVRLVFLYSAITDDNDSYIHSLQLQLIYKTNFEKKGYNGMSEDDYHDYLLSTIYNHDEIYFIPTTFLLRVTHTLVAPSDDGVEDVNKFILKSDEVKQRNFEFFKKYIEQQQQYTPMVSSLYRLCIDHIENHRVIIMKEANDVMREFLHKDKTNEYLNGFLVFNQENDTQCVMAFKDPFFKQIFPVDGEVDLFAKYVENSLQEDDANRTEILAYLKRYRKAGSDHAGYYYMKTDNPNPTHMEIIEGLRF